MCIEVLTLGCDNHCWELTPEGIFHDMKDPNHPMMMVGVIVVSSTLSFVGAPTCTRVWGTTLDIMGWGLRSFRKGSTQG